MCECMTSPSLVFTLLGREGEEAGVNGVHAHVAHHSQRHAEKWYMVAGDRQSAHLTFKTVADLVRSHACVIA